MKKPDEIALMAAIYRGIYHDDPADCVWPRDVAYDLGMSEKRAAYLCEKWASKGLYVYGVNVLLGWLTEDGEKMAQVARALLDAHAELPPVPPGMSGRAISERAYMDARAARIKSSKEGT